MQKNTNTILNMLFKKIFCLITFVLISAQCFSYDMEDFYELNPKEQVDLWLEEYSYKTNKAGSLILTKTNDYFCKPENIPTYAPLLIEKLKSIELGDYYEVPYSFWLIDVNIGTMNKELTKELKHEIIKLYNKKIFEHIAKYKSIDYSVYELYKSISYLEDGIKPVYSALNPYELKTKYETEGIENITIEWTGLKERCFFNQESFSSSRNKEKSDFGLKEYSPDFKMLIGKTGQRGGIVFYTEGNRAWEYIDLNSEFHWKGIIKELANYFAGRDLEDDLWAPHIDLSKIKREDDDWRMPTPTELNWIYKFLENSETYRPEKWYWTSEMKEGSWSYVQRLSDGRQSTNNKGINCSVILVRTYKIDRTIKTVKEKYSIGDIGPGNGIIFYIEGNKAWECTEKLGESLINSNSLTEKIAKTKRYECDDWHLPSSQELALVYKNLQKKDIVNLKDWYWGLDKRKVNNYYSFIAQNFSTGQQEYRSERECHSFFAVRNFSY